MRLSTTLCLRSAGTDFNSFSTAREEDAYLFIYYWEYFWMQNKVAETFPSQTSCIVLNRLFVLYDELQSCCHTFSCCQTALTIGICYGRKHADEIRFWQSTNRYELYCFLYLLRLSSGFTGRTKLMHITNNLIFIVSLEKKQINTSAKKYSNEVLKKSLVFHIKWSHDEKRQGDHITVIPQATSFSGLSALWECRVWIIAGISAVNKNKDELWDAMIHHGGKKYI